MNLYLDEILSKKPRIIIPEFGAFIVKQKNPRLIVFNEFLQYNDGELIDFIIQKEKIDKEQATNRVQKFVESTVKKLSMGDKVPIPGLGLLEKSSSGKINLVEAKDIPASDDSTKEEAEKPKPEAKKEPAKPAKIKADEKAETIKEETKEKKESAEKVEKPESPKTEKVEVPPVKEEKQTEQAEKKTEPKKEKTATPGIDLPLNETKAKPEAKSFKTEVSSKEEKQPEETKKEEIPPKKETTPPLTPSTAAKSEPAKESVKTYSAKEPVKSTSYYATQEKKKSKRGRIILWIIIIVFINALIIGYFVFNDEVNEFIAKYQDKASEEPVDLADDEKSDEEIPPDEEMTDEEEQKVEIGKKSVKTEDKIKESIKLWETQKQSTTTEKKQVAPVKEDATVSGSQSKRYYVMAGAFSNESNADRLVEELRAKGYNAEKFAYIGQMHYVSYGSFGNISDAKTLLNRVKEEENQSTWIKKY